MIRKFTDNNSFTVIDKRDLYAVIYLFVSTAVCAVIYILLEKQIFHISSYSSLLMISIAMSIIYFKREERVYYYLIRLTVNIFMLITFYKLYFYNNANALDSKLKRAFFEQDFNYVAFSIFGLQFIIVAIWVVFPKSGKQK